MKNVVFVAPFAFDTTLRFVEAAAEQPGVRLGLISQDPLAKFPPGLRREIAAHQQVSNALEVDEIAVATERISKSIGPVHCLLGTLEQLQVQLAKAREMLGIAGMSSETAENFRDKARMKDVLRKAGVPCAAHRLLYQLDDALEFVGEVGYPIVIKPPAGAGAKETAAIGNEDELRSFLADHPASPRRPFLAEEFLQGSEHSFDGVSIGGELVWHSLTHYLPSPLEAVRNRWIQWCVLLPREIDDPRYDDIRQTARDSLAALGMSTGMCHLEWFRRPDGSLAISEVGARPGGAQISKLISYAHDFHFYRAWATLMIEGTFKIPERKFATGAAFLRGQGRGTVKAIHGLEQVQAEVGSLVVETVLPRAGQSPSSSYEGDGFILLKHPETELVERALRRVVSLVRVELG